MHAYVLKPTDNGFQLIGWGNYSLASIMKITRLYPDSMIVGVDKSFCDTTQVKRFPKYLPGYWCRQDIAEFLIDWERYSQAEGFNHEVNNTLIATWDEYFEYTTAA